MLRADLDADLHLARDILGQGYAVDRLGELFGLASDPAGAAIDDAAVIVDRSEVAAQGDVAGR